MRKSYVRENSLEVVINIDLGGLNDLIAAVEPTATAEGTGWVFRRTLENLREIRREAIAEAVRGFQAIASE
jgi:glycogen synthase